MSLLDETDRRLLLALDEDPRLPVAILAQRLSLARGTVHARLERLDGQACCVRAPREYGPKHLAEASQRRFAWSSISI